uniref:Uncharacterized protein n=1 Tax=Acrobeloides nanus TaxID=290746 RepID=A0A914EM68_9BILA
MLRFFILLGICLLFVHAQVGPCLPNGRCQSGYTCNTATQLCVINSASTKGPRHSSSGSNSREGGRHFGGGRSGQRGQRHDFGYF